MTELGTVLLVVGLGATVASTLANIYASWAESARWLIRGRWFTYLSAGVVLAALALLVYYFLTDSFFIAYVAENSMRSQPLAYKLSAVWSGQSGSLLLWAAFLAGFGAIVARTKRVPKLTGYATGIIMLTVVFFLTVLLVTDPFVRTLEAYPNLTMVPQDGMGINPMLQNPGMFFHPPTLYVGYAGFVVPFAFAVAGLLAGRQDWVEHTRRWTVFSWIFLTVGIVVGAWWAYVILGWGGYWAWDPVENASLLPWLTGTAFLHSVMIHERRGRLKVWNHLLIVATYLLTIYGVFLTRSGIVQSVHSFARSQIAPFFVGFMGIVLVSWITLIIWRWDDVTVDGPLSESVISKEMSFLLNNLVLLGLAFVVFWGTSFPFMSELLLGETVSIGTSFYNQLTPPLAVGLLFLLAVCPLIPWQRTNLAQLRYRFEPAAVAGVTAGIAGGFFFTSITGLVLGLLFFVAGTHLYDVYRTYRVTVLHERDIGAVRRFFMMVWNNRRRYGGYIVHFGIIVIVLGITWSTVFAVSDTVAVGPDSRAEIPGGYSVELAGFQNESMGNHYSAGPNLDVYDSSGQFVYQATPRLDTYPRRDTTLRDPDIWGTTARDLYFIYNGVRNGMVQLEVKYLPFVSLLWWGSGIVVAGGLLALWPEIGGTSEREIGGRPPEESDAPSEEVDE
ncbi:MAG: heme lyase CcmF/NrfE family subunit [Halodesulfurarchaeum sp.]